MAYTVQPDNPASPLNDDFPASLVAAELRALKQKLLDLDAKIDSSALPVGVILAYADPTETSLGANFLPLPLTPTNVSRTTYAKLFTAIGTKWGAGDGSTTFGLPYVQEGSTLIKGSTAVVSEGESGAHTHEYEDGFCVNQNGNPVFSGENLPTVPVDIANQWEFGGHLHRRKLDTSSAGTGTANKPAGTSVRFFIKVS